MCLLLLHQLQLSSWGIRPWKLGAPWAQPSAFTASPFCSLAFSSLASRVSWLRHGTTTTRWMSSLDKHGSPAARHMADESGCAAIVVGGASASAWAAWVWTMVSFPGALKETEGSRQGNCTAGPWPKGEEPGSLHHVCLLCCVLEFERQLPTASAEIPP